MKTRYIKRDLEEDVFKWIYEREILVIRGPRQCGKTTMLNKIRETLLQKNITDESIHYLNFEEDILRINFEKDPKAFIKLYLREGKNYFLMDEVQYVKEIGRKLKLVFDSFDNIKIIITGSSSFDLTNLGKYLVGRAIFFDLFPFNFHEFLKTKGERHEKLYNKIKINLKHPKIKKGLFLEDLNKLLHEYLTFGGYPRVVLESNKEKKKILLKNIFITYVEKDIVSLYGNKYRDNVVRLLKILSSILGGIVKYETLVESSGLKYHKVRELLPLLQDSFVISIVKPFYKNITSELRKNPKIYFIDFGIRNYLLENFDNIIFDSLYENFVYNQLKKDYEVKYWRTTTKTEVDFILEKEIPIPIEVKLTKKVTRALRSFIKSYECRKGFVANLQSFEKIDKSIYAVPFVYF